MSEKSLAEKLLIKPGRSVYIAHAPQGYLSQLGAPSDASIQTQPPAEPVDILQLFVLNRQELQAQLGQMKALLKPDGSLWVTYYKGTSKTKTDINRDSIYAYALTLGLQAVAMVSIDEDWSGLRLKIVK